MREPMPKDEDADDGVYEFVCMRCGITEFLTLTADNQVPHCRCGSPLSPIARVAGSSAERDTCGELFLDELCGKPERLDPQFEGLSPPMGRADSAEEAIGEVPDYGSLDHPHAEPHCQFCAIREQRPRLHRLWCAVFSLRDCSCGYEGSLLRGSCPG